MGILLISKFYTEMQTVERYREVRSRVTAELHRIDRMACLSNKASTISVYFFIYANWMRVCEMVRQPNVFYPLWFFGNYFFI